MGLDGAPIADALPDIRVEPVLTAHPTEAKRATVLEHHRRLFLLLVDRENPIYTPSEQATIRQQIKVELERLWRTGEVFLERPDVASELRNVLHYLQNVFPEAQRLLDRRLRQAWTAAGLDEALLDASHLPRLRFGNWIGGDRDGHPLVTADTTENTLETLRRSALLLLHRHLTDLVVRLSISERLATPPDAVSGYVEATASRLGKRERRAVARNPEEPWRQMVNLMIAQLPVEVDASGGGRLRDTPDTYRTATGLAHDLQLLHDSLVDAGLDRLAAADVEPVLRTVETFGFRLARLDVRRNSRFHDLAVDQLLRAAGAEETDFSTWPETRRRDFLNRELSQRRPFAMPGQSLGAEAEDANAERADTDEADAVRGPLPPEPIDKVVVPVDFSDPSRAALRYAVQMASTYDVPLTLIHVVNLPKTPEAYGIEFSDQIDLISRAQAELERWKEEIVPDGQEASCIVTASNSVSSILDAASTPGDLLVMATRGLSGMKRVVLGSVAEGVLRKAHGPVLTGRSFPSPA